MTARFKQSSFQTQLLEAKADEGGHTGTVRALVSAFGNVDHMGDRVVKGAFAATLKQWRSDGDPIPFIWSHNWREPDAHVGWIPPERAKETDRGLEVEASIDLFDPPAAKVYRLLADRRIRQFSFAYDVVKEELTDEETDEGWWGKVNELHELKLYECGPCLLGANQETDLIEVAARRAVLDRPLGKVGRTLSAATRQKLGEVLEAEEHAQGLLRDVLASDEAEGEAGRSGSVAKSAIASHSTGTSDAPWDGGAQERALPDTMASGGYRRMYAWNDPEGDPDTQAAYRFPHHFVVNGNPGTASLVAASAGIGNLNGGRGGTTIPTGDRQGVWNHLARHLRDGDQEPPELASAEELAGAPAELSALDHLVIDAGGGPT